jgi:hypothetical protein
MKWRDTSVFRRYFKVLVIGACAALALVIAIPVLLCSVDAAVAEETLGAYRLVLDVVTTHVRDGGGTWPRSWEELYGVTPSDRYLTWRWPEDAHRIRKRVEIDFTLTPADVASMDAESFSAIRQLGPNYGPEPAQISALLEAVRIRLRDQHNSLP